MARKPSGAQLFWKGGSSAVDDFKLSSQSGGSSDIGVGGGRGTDRTANESGVVTGGVLCCFHFVRTFVGFIILKRKLLQRKQY